jgi:GGDEF domain-containing protein
MFDLDEGVEAGELRRIAGALAASRLYDVAARIDPRRFVLLLPETGAEAARVAVERVRHEAGLDKRSGARVGIATFEWPPTCVDDLLREGDRVMQAVGKDVAPCLRHAVHRGTSLTPVPSGRLSRA